MASSFPDDQSPATATGAVRPRKVLVVSPNFPPTGAPDLHRVRMACAHLLEFGWEPLVLAVDAGHQSAPRDETLEQTLPAGIRVWRTAALPEKVTRLAGFGNIGWRALPYLAREGSRIIAAERPAVAFFSTTMFATFLLGPHWLRKHGLPYVLDMHDPWHADLGILPDAFRARWKRRLANAVAGVLEAHVMRRASHVVCVSPHYPPMLQARYPDIAATRFSVLPFGGAERDYAVLGDRAPAPGLPERADGLIHWVYAGAVSPEMRFAARAFFLALARARAASPEAWTSLRVHFLGTHYSTTSGEVHPLERIADECGVRDLVREVPTRLPYLDALQWLRRADALIVLGATDPGYSASKVFPYILARKPMLALMNDTSNVAEIIARTHAGVLVRFRAGESADQVAERIVRSWFAGAWSRPPETDWQAFAPYTARSMTARLGAIFDDVAESRRAP